MLEVLAVRILSPYSGNTIYTYSSVLSIILAALSVGYYLGGILSECKNLVRLFYEIILITGVSILLIRLMDIFILPIIGYKLPYQTGPLIMSIMLFFLPGLLLGIISPLAINIRKKTYPKQKAGKIFSEILFFSTIGNIFGGLSTSFIFIPNFGISIIITAAGIILLVIGIGGLILNNSIKGKTKYIVIFILATSLFINFSSEETGQPVIYSKDGVYEKIKVFDTFFKGKPVRVLQQDRSISGVMYLPSGEITPQNMKYFILYKLYKNDIKNALILGGGAYLIPKELLKISPNAEINVAEIEPILFDIAKKYFYLPDDKRLHNYTIDGRKFLNSIDKKYDLIYSDAFYTYFSLPVNFSTYEFFRSIKQHLNSEGIAIINLIDELTPKKKSFIFSEMKTLKTVFLNCHFFAVASPFSKEVQNIIFLGYNGNKKIDINNKEVTNNENPLIKGLPEKIINLTLYDLERYPILTDDYSPVEYLIGNTLKNIKTDKKITALFDFLPD